MNPAKKPFVEYRAAVYRAAEGLGHRRIGSEHLLLALVGADSASGQALRASGLTYESVLDALSGLPAGYHKSKQPGATSPGPSLVEESDTQLIFARAEGLAADLGRADLRDEHVLLSLLWEPRSLLALRLIERQGVTAEQVLDELGRRGVAIPEVPPPTRPSWGPPFYVSREEFEQLAADLRQRGVLYRFNYKGEQVVVSIDEKGEGT